MSENREKRSRLAKRLDRVAPDRTTLFSAGVLKWLGFVCVCMNTFSVSVLQQITAKMSAAGREVTVVAALSVTLAMLATLAIPVYAKLLAEGWYHTSNVRRYLLRLMGVALLAECPYDLSVKGVWVDMEEQNPVWGLVLALLVLMIFRWMAERKQAGILPLGILAILAACGWATMLQINTGVLLILLTVSFVLMREHRYISLVVGALLSLIQFPSPLGMLFVHCYGGQPVKQPKWLFYLLYPAQLLLFGCVAALIG